MIVVVGSAISRLKAEDQPVGLSDQDRVVGNSQDKVNATSMEGFTDGALREYDVVDKNRMVMTFQVVDFKEANTLRCL